MQEARLLARLLEAEASRLAGRVDALRRLLRFVDTRAAELLHTVDDVLLEAAQRRASAGAATYASGDAAAGQHGTGSLLQSGAPAHMQRAAARGSGMAAAHGKGAGDVLGAGLWWPANAVPGGGATGAGGLARGRGGPAAWAHEHSNGHPTGSRAPAAAAAGGVPETSGDSSSEVYSSGSESSGSGSSTASSSGSRSSRQARGMGGAGRARAGGLELQLVALKLDNMDALEPARLALQARLRTHVNTMCNSYLLDRQILGGYCAQLFPREPASFFCVFKCVYRRSSSRIHQMQVAFTLLLPVCPGHVHSTSFPYFLCAGVMRALPAHWGADLGNRLGGGWIKDAGWIFYNGVSLPCWFSLAAAPPLLCWDATSMLIQSRSNAYRPPFCAGAFAVGATESGRSHLRRALFMSALQ